MLDQMQKRLSAERTFGRAIARILDDAMALNGAEYGTLQLAAQDRLLLVHHRGFQPAFLELFRMVPRDHGSACGRALTSGRTVVIEDVERDAEFAPFRPAARAAGYRSVVTTPLLRNGHDLVGVVATHFVNVHRPTAIEIGTFERYSAVAADHLVGLLGARSVAGMAAEMNDALYARAAGD